MKKLFLFCVALLMAFGAGARAEGGVTLKTVSTFAGTEAAVDAYAELLKTWQDRTGHTVSDFSATSDEAWKVSVLKDFAAGNEADVLFFFSGTQESAAILSKVVPIEDINEAYPELELPIDPRMAERDGRVYAIPVRPIWEGLFCNADLFEQYGVELPTTWEKLEAAIKAFRAVGIVPISVSLSDVPHYLLEFCILSAGSPEAHAARPQAGEAVPDSWVEGMRLLRRLFELGAFDQNVNATTEAVTSQMFRDKKAAMQVDGSWFANTLSTGAMDTTVVLPFPAYSAEADPTAYIYGVTMGFYLSRSAWEDAARRSAAVDLLRFLTTRESAEKLGYRLSGRLLASYEAMESAASTLSQPIQDAMNADARRRWFASAPDIANGSMDPARMWSEIMEMEPFVGP